MRNFDTGATRDTDEGKLDFEGFLSPIVLQRFAEYMHENRIQADGNLRDSDNWQKGIPMEAYVKSAWRHFFSWWHSWRRGDRDGGVQDACALLFNIQGWLHEQLKPEALTATEKIAAGLTKGLAEKTPQFSDLEQPYYGSKRRREVRYEVNPNEGDTTKNGCYETPEPIIGREVEYGDITIEALEWEVTCSCGWSGTTDELILDQLNRGCLCPTCHAVLMGLSIEVTLPDDADNVYEQIGKAVSLGLAYGMGLPRLISLVEHIYLKETSE